jgi:L-threonylcarbamoyladenylate synthase
VRDEFGDAVDMILDGGPCTVGIESTVVDISGAQPAILRPGKISKQEIEQVIGPVSASRIVADPASAAMSPGQQAVHYAPRTPAYRFEPGDRMKLDTTNAAVLEIALDPETYARNLYSKLRLLDSQKLRAIYVEMPPDLPEWNAVRDRLMRATRSRS